MLLSLSQTSVTPNYMLATGLTCMVECGSRPSTDNFLWQQAESITRSYNVQNKEQLMLGCPAPIYPQHNP